jgi:iron complex transport system ATP-binding protein
MTMSHFAVRAADLAVGYRSRRLTRAVLEGVNLTAQPGEFVCLLGPNGIGKSTLLRTLVRMQPPLWGRIEVEGAGLETFSATTLAQKIGVVLTERVVIESLSARRIVELGRYPHSGWLGRLRPEDHHVVEWAIGSVGAAHLSERDFNQLSDGERQRVMIARALAQQPSVLVLDEPTAFLDVPSRVELMGLLRQLTRNTDLTVIASTHDLELALRTADTLWLLMPGGEVMAGAPEDVVWRGGIAQAFEGRHIRFHAEERSFRLQTGHRGSARINGTGLRASLALGVLEREGFAVADPPAGDDAVLTINVTEHGWHGSNNAHTGGDFASLAAYARQWGEGHEKH